jgi:hypothetical protein
MPVIPPAENYTPPEQFTDQLNFLLAQFPGPGKNRNGRGLFPRPPLGTRVATACKLRRTVTGTCVTWWRGTTLTAPPPSRHSDQPVGGASKFLRFGQNSPFIVGMSARSIRISTRNDTLGVSYNPGHSRMQLAFPGLAATKQQTHQWLAAN